jgi:hypothetical protein
MEGVTRVGGGAYVRLRLSVSLGPMKDRNART